MFQQGIFAITFLRQDPLPILGFLLIGLSALVTFRLHVKLREIGAASYGSLRNLIFTIPRTYLRVGQSRG